MGDLREEGKALEIAQSVQDIDLEGWRNRLNDSKQKLQEVERRVRRTDSSLNGGLKNLQGNLRYLKSLLDEKRNKEQIMQLEIDRLDRLIAELERQIEEAKKNAKEMMGKAREMEEQKDNWTFRSYLRGGAAVLGGILVSTATGNNCLCM